MSMKKIIKTIYKLELSEETYKKVVELMESTGNMEKELKEFGVIKHKTIDEIIKNNNLNKPTPYAPFQATPRVFACDKQSKDKDIISKTLCHFGVSEEELKDGVHFAVIPCDDIESLKRKEIKSIVDFIKQKKEMD